jgi:hypothetical protein
LDILENVGDYFHREANAWYALGFVDEYDFVAANDGSNEFRISVGEHTSNAGVITI